ncbi:MAG TPA: fluoride efflux transporter CrcB [Actinomycetota bacterium]|nr:fluoride efflux transporter CrcB [Actinomycetota bacterium]
MSGLAWAGFVVACALGALARCLVDGWAENRFGASFQWGTLVVNVTGSLVMGVLAGLALNSQIALVPLAIAGTGFCGAYTTFSTFAVQTIALAQEQGNSAAALNALGSLLAGLTAAGCGLWLGNL